LQYLSEKDKKWETAFAAMPEEELRAFVITADRIFRECRESRKGKIEAEEGRSAEAVLHSFED